MPKIAGGAYTHFKELFGKFEPGIRLRAYPGILAPGIISEVLSIVPLEKDSTVPSTLPLGVSTETHLRVSIGIPLRVIPEDSQRFQPETSPAITYEIPTLGDPS